MSVTMSSCVFCFVKQKTAYEMRISDWSSDVCSSDLHGAHQARAQFDKVGNKGVLGSFLCHVGVPGFVLLASVSVNPGRGNDDAESSSRALGVSAGTGAASLASALVASASVWTEAEASLSACWASSRGLRRLER